MKAIAYGQAILLSLCFSGTAISSESSSFNFFSSSSAVNSDQFIANSLTVDKNDGIVISKGQYNGSLKDVSTASSIKFNLLGKTINFQVNDVNQKTKLRTAFSASSVDGHDTLQFAENDGEVVGSLHHAGKLYKIRPAANGETVVIEVPNEKLVDHGKDYHEDRYLEHNHWVDASDAAEVDAGNGVLNANTEFTVIVAYTSAFARAAGNINAYMDLLEQETNTSYANSQVNARVRIVHSYQTSYRDSGDFYQDRNYFSNTNNAEARELNDRRNTHRADLMIVLTGNGYSFCGVASAIGATQSSALAFASETCATGYYSFGHEIGHLFGARHIIYTDSSTTPFAYGHGYCNTRSNTWRTVMAYGCPWGTGGPRIQQWSNPNVRISGDPTGTQDVEFNAKVMNVRVNAVAGFR